MNSFFIKYLFRFIALVLLQVMVLNNIELNRFLNPYLYVLFIIFLPFSTPKWLLLFLSFLLGLSVDIFMKTPGMNASACVLMGFARPGIIFFLSRGMDIEKNMKPGIPDFGKRWFFTYLFILVFIHHFSLFLLESFSFNNFPDILYLTIINTFLTSFLIIVLHYMSIVKK